MSAQYRQPRLLGALALLRDPKELDGEGKAVGTLDAWRYSSPTKDPLQVAVMCACLLVPVVKVLKILQRTPILVQVAPKKGFNQVQPPQKQTKTPQEMFGSLGNTNQPTNPPTSQPSNQPTNQPTNKPTTPTNHCRFSSATKQPSLPWNPLEVWEKQPPQQPVREPTSWAKWFSFEKNTFFFFGGGSLCFFVIVSLCIFMLFSMFNGSSSSSCSSSCSSSSPCSYYSFCSCSCSCFVVVVNVDVNVVPFWVVCVYI